MNHYKIQYHLQLTITIISGILMALIIGFYFVPFIQAFMGVYQTICAISLLFVFKHFPTYIQKHLKIYGIVWLINAFLTFLLFYGFSKGWHLPDWLATTCYFLFYAIPWSSAIYFITILKKLANWKDEQMSKTYLDIA